MRKTTWIARAAARLGVSALLVLAATPVSAYSVLTHQAIIDSAWPHILPRLKARFPQATTDELFQARAYAYGGCIIQDMGYFPFGNKFFSDLLHYVRSGDFITNELAEAQNLNEYAFALGSLAHYVADSEGHSVAVNPTVGAEYPKLKREFGPSVTYADNPNAHLRVEFSFDVLQVARGSYAPDKYHDAIGFAVADGLLDRAFFDTYGLHTKDLFSDLDGAIATYRYAVRNLIPQLTKQAWHSDHDDLVRSTPGITRARFVYSMNLRSFRKEWKYKYRQPSIFIRFLGSLVQVLPKIGPLKFLAFKQPNSQTETWFVESFNHTVQRYGALALQAGNRNFRLTNMNLDTGETVKPSKYSLADTTYAQLAIRLAQSKDAQPDPKLTAAVLEYFVNPNLPFATKKNPAEWKQLTDALDKLKAATP